MQILKCMERQRKALTSESGGKPYNKGTLQQGELEVNSVYVCVGEPEDKDNPSCMPMTHLLTSCYTGFI